MRLHSEIDVNVRCHKCRSLLTEADGKCADLGHPVLYVNPHACQAEQCKRCAELEAEVCKLDAKVRTVRAERDRLGDELADIRIRHDAEHGNVVRLRNELDKANSCMLRIVNARDMWHRRHDEIKAELAALRADTPEPAEVPIRVGQVWESAVAKVRSEVIAIRGERVVMWATPNDSWAPWTTTATELREAEYILVSEPEA